MEASIVDLRYKTTEILKALERNESVTVLYHGKVKGIIQPAHGQKKSRIIDHPFFGMLATDSPPVEDIMSQLRKPRHAV